MTGGSYGWWPNTRSDGSFTVTGLIDGAYTVNVGPFGGASLASTTVTVNGANVNVGTIGN